MNKPTLLPRQRSQGEGRAKDAIFWCGAFDIGEFRDEDLEEGIRNCKEMAHLVLYEGNNDF